MSSSAACKAPIHDLESEILSAASAVGNGKGGGTTNAIQCLERLAQSALADSRFVAAVRQRIPNLRPRLSPTNIFAPVSTPAKSIFALLCLYSR
jgi:hypothetical protein